MLTRSHRQESFCRAYVRAVAAMAGVSVSEPEIDYGIDLTLRGIEVIGRRHRDVGPQIDLQLKSTTRARVGESDVACDIPVNNFDDLRQVRPFCPRLLVVLVMPVEESAWLAQSLDELAIRHCAFWMSLEGLPATSATTTVRLRVPLANVFSPSAVQHLLERVRERKDP